MHSEPFHKGPDFIPLHSFLRVSIASRNISPTLPSYVLKSSHPTLRAPNLPHQVCDADLLARLLVVVEPLALVQLDRLELGPGLLARGKPFALPTWSVLQTLHKQTRRTHIGLELDKLQPPTIKLQDILHLGRIAALVDGGRSLDVGRVLTLQKISAPTHLDNPNRLNQIVKGNMEGEYDLTVLALPHEIRLPFTPTDFILLEPADRHPVRMRLAARCALHFECVVEGGVFGVDRAQGSDAV
jgi:hypothetical protein